MKVREKIKNDYLKRMRKLFEIKLNGRNLIKVGNTWALPTHKILKTIFKMKERRILTNRAENKNTNDDAQGIIPEMT